MPDMREADITISGKPLTVGQSMTVRVACSNFLTELNDPKSVVGFGQIGIAYRQRLQEILLLIGETAA